MFLFAKRKKLEESYRKWLSENPQVKDCAFSFISFLELNNLIDVKKALEFIEKMEE